MMPFLQKVMIWATCLSLLCFRPTVVQAFAPPTPTRSTTPTTALSMTAKGPAWMASLSATAAVVAANIPAVVYAAVDALEDDSYEYGKVDAPIGLALGGGILAILTAAVPVLLAPGEEALEEMRENEGYTFGSKDASDTLNKRR
mmetsp:Transcript_13773/g.28438  ORF Transcript_13773/g.28438 Transcript_13773/m.28438 type:complete len:144 (-) Transcript_13773:466-897(-)